MTKYFTTILFCLIFTGAGYSDILTNLVITAGSPAPNPNVIGTYTQTSDVNGYPRWYSTNGFYVVYGSSGYYWITTNGDGDTTESENDLHSFEPQVIPVGTYVEGGPGGSVAEALYSIITNDLPFKPINPIPTNNATGQLTNTIVSWENGGFATSYKMSFGTSGDMTDRGSTTGTNYNPGALFYGSNYQWRVDASNFYGTATGDVWTFTIKDAPPVVLLLRASSISKVNASSISAIRKGMQ